MDPQSETPLLHLQEWVVKGKTIPIYYVVPLRTDIVVGLFESMLTNGVGVQQICCTLKLCCARTLLIYPL